jgi:hypothetical protein
MPDASTKTHEVLDAPGSAEGAAAELAVLQSKAQVSPELLKSFPAGKIAEVANGVSTVSGKIAKYGGELAEDNKKLAEATELLGGLAKTFAEAATLISVLSYAFAALGAVMGFLNSLLAPDPTAEILNAIKELSEQMVRFQNFVEVELAELKQDVDIQPKLQTVSQTRTKLEIIQMHMSEYAKGEELETPRAELVQCEDPAMLARQIHDAYVVDDGINPNLLQLLYEKTGGEASRLAPMIYQNIALMMTALRARTLRSCIQHENHTGKAPDQDQVWRFAQTASSEIGPLVESLARQGVLILQKCERDLDVNYRRKLQYLFPKIAVLAADEATHSQAASTIRNALKPYSQYQWHVLVYKDVDKGQANSRLNSHAGIFDGFFRQQCKDGKACIVVVKSRPPEPDKGFLETLQQHCFPLPDICDEFAQRRTIAFESGQIFCPVNRDGLFDKMDLRGLNVAVHDFASTVHGGKVLYLGIVRPELNPACATTATGPAGMSLWCPLHQMLGEGDDGDSNTPIKLFCVATA